MTSFGTKSSRGLGVGSTRRRSEWRRHATSSLIEGDDVIVGSAPENVIEQGAKVRLILNHQQRQAVRKLPFCYLCGQEFVDGEAIDGDHVPPECIFKKEHREPLILRTHVVCNSAHKLVDEKVGQLISLRRGSAPRPENRRLRVRTVPAGAALWNLDLDAAVWRWIMGFHAALYDQPLQFGPTGDPQKPFARSLTFPFPKAPKETGAIEPLLLQHLRFVETLKSNRFRNNVDQIGCNKGQLVYECVWDRFDNTDQWMCIFGLNLCDWKDLGRAPGQPARGCAGCYVIEASDVPSNASRSARSSIIVPNYDRLDPFAP